MEQFRLIQQAWKRVKDGQFEAFTAQTVVADPLGWWGLQFYDTLFALNPALKPLFNLYSAYCRKGGGGRVRQHLPPGHANVHRRLFLTIVAIKRSESFAKLHANRP
jgi:hypothetical protein